MPDGAAVEPDVFSIYLAETPRTAGTEKSQTFQLSRALGTQSFVVGPENRLAAASLGWIRESAHSIYSPVLLHGASGTGKSFLARWVAEAFHEVVSTDGREFARELADAIKTDKTSVWRAKYRSADLLVFEDLPSLGGRSAAQQELVHLLDWLEWEGKTVIITSLKPPHELADFIPALASRLAGGLMLHVSPPGAAARREIIERYLTESGLRVSGEGVELLAKTITGRAPQVRGSLQELTALSVLRGIRPEGALGEEDIRPFLTGRRPIEVDVGSIISIVAKQFGLKPRDVSGVSRRRQTALARSIAIYLTRELTCKSWNSIGSHFSNRDHTTVLHAYRTAAARLATDSALSSCIDGLRRNIVERGSQ